DAASGKITPVGKPGIIESARISPDGQYMVVTTIHRPFSYVYPARQFPKEVEVWDRSGKLAHKIASLPLGGGGRGGAAPPRGDAGRPPPSGTRSLEWRPGDPATLMWMESIGPVPPRNQTAGARGANTPPRPDHILALKAPFSGQPAEIFKWSQA